MTAKKILAIRKKIDKIDSAIIKKLAIRQKLVMTIGRIKIKSGIQIQDIIREKQQKNLYRELSRQLNLDPRYINQIFHLVITHSRELQKHVSKQQPHLRQGSLNRRKK
jgi:chorismate mutase/prephenate dehydratase